MVDETDADPTPCQPPTLTELAAARGGAVLARQIDLEWLMAPEGHDRRLSRPAPQSTSLAPVSGVSRSGPSAPLPEAGLVARLTPRPTARVSGEGALPRVSPRGGVDGRPWGETSGGIARSCGAAWREGR